MKKTYSKIFSSFLLIAFFVGIYFSIEQVLLVYSYQNLQKEYDLPFNTDRLIIEKREFESDIIRQKYFHSDDVTILDSKPFLSLENLDTNRYRQQLKKNVMAYNLLFSLDSIIINETKISEWKMNREEIKKTLNQIVQLNPRIKLKDNDFEIDLEPLLLKKTITKKEYREFLYAFSCFRWLIRIEHQPTCSMMFGHHTIQPIPSKTVVEMGDTVFIDWLNYYSHNNALNNSYSITSNFEKYHTVSSFYNGSDGNNKSFFIDEWQIPFSKLKDNPKWKSTFYFINHNLKQDSVVLERNLKKEIQF